MVNIFKDNTGNKPIDRDEFTFYEDKYEPMCWDCFNSLLSLGKFCIKHDDKNLKTAR